MIAFLQALPWFIAALCAVALMVTVGCFVDYRGRQIRGDQIGSIARDIAGRTHYATAVPSIAVDVVVRDGTFMVNGVDLTNQLNVDLTRVLEIRLMGDVYKVDCDKNLTIVGDVEESVRAGGNVNCDAVGGHIAADGNVTCDAVCGDIDAAGNVTCDDVDGDVKAGGNVNCNDVGYNVTANGSVTCDDVGGSIKAGGDVNVG